MVMKKLDAQTQSLLKRLFKGVVLGHEPKHIAHVADSVPALEELETQNKARAVLQAIATAETLRTVVGDSG